MDMDFVINIEGININFTDIELSYSRLQNITTLTSKKIYTLLSSMFETKEAVSNLRIPVLWVSPRNISNEMSDDEIADVLSKAVIDAIKQRV